MGSVVNIIGGDAIFFANIPTVMEVGGEVNVPGFYKFASGRRVNDYINFFAIIS